MDGGVISLATRCAFFFDKWNLPHRIVSSLITNIKKIAHLQNSFTQLMF